MMVLSSLLIPKNTTLIGLSSDFAIAAVLRMIDDRRDCGIDSDMAR